MPTSRRQLQHSSSSTAALLAGLVAVPLQCYCPGLGVCTRWGLRRMVMYITAALPNHLSPAFALCSCATVLLVVGRRERHAWLDDWLLGCSPAGPEWRWSCC
ncbi:hypothetical protein DdX_01625 [Ditylenchus destructor]|uniref:Uncharacterized protein n=1 Tax=Ditylenchus destructor TaxID=166010 RepID=A0AAD4NM58_9BILA|nr:hypothetical protein DdX_01625 [Ditylenchus destructor]